jgi:hypothetical protein
MSVDYLIIPLLDKEGLGEVFGNYLTITPPCLPLQRGGVF